MHLHCRTLLCATLLVVVAIVGCAEAEAEPERPTAPKPSPTTAPVAPGEAFPAGAYDALNADGGRIDLSSALGSRPVAMCYWIPNHPRSERVLTEFASLAAEVGSDALSAYAVAVPRPNIGREVIEARVAELGLELPVLIDEGFGIGKALRVNTVPSMALVDSEGLLRLANAASLRQELGYKLDVETAIRKLADSGTLMTHGYLDRYYPAKELEGQDCPDFKAPLLSNDVERRYHTLFDDTKLNVLVFWSVDCPHCRTYMPKIQEWANGQGDVNVVTAANVDSPATKIKTREFSRANALSFATMVDKDSKIGALFQITTTPTIVIIGPDRRIDTVLTSTTADFAKKIEERKRSLL